MEISDKSVGQMLKESREQSRLTQEQLAQRLGKREVIFQNWKQSMATTSSFKH